MFTRGVSLKEVDFVSYTDSKFVDLKEKFMKGLKEDLPSNITSLINEQNRQTGSNTTEFGYIGIAK